MTFTIKNLKPKIGAMVQTDRATLLDGTRAELIRDLLEERAVLIFRGIELSDEEQIAFTATLGTLGDDGYRVTFDEAANPTPTDYNLGNFSWHMDRTDLDTPPFATLLNARRLSPPGTGNTMFANTTAAYSDLPADDKAQIDRLQVRHRVRSSFRETVPNPTEEQLARWNSHPPKVHPLVWHHRSGRNSLVLSTSGGEVLGMEQAEGEALLARMMAWATQPEYVYTHEWQVGDLVLWDNTGAMHKVQPYDFTCGRLLFRTTLAGVEPIRAVQATTG